MSEPYSITKKLCEFPHPEILPRAYPQQTAHLFEFRASQYTIGRNVRIGCPLTSRAAHRWFKTIQNILNGSTDSMSVHKQSWEQHKYSKCLWYIIIEWMRSIYLPWNEGVYRKLVALKPVLDLGGGWAGYVMNTTVTSSINHHVYT